MKRVSIIFGLVVLTLLIFSTVVYAEYDGYDEFILNQYNPESESHCNAPFFKFEVDSPKNSFYDVYFQPQIDGIGSVENRNMKTDPADYEFRIGPIIYDDYRKLEWRYKDGTIEWRTSGFKYNTKSGTSGTGYLSQYSQTINYVPYMRIEDTQQPDYSLYPPELPVGTYGCKFILPLHKFKDNSFLFSYQLMFRLPYTENFKLSDVNFKINSPDVDSLEEYNFDMYSWDSWKQGGEIVGYIKFSLEQPVGITTITASINYNNIQYPETWIQTERLGGFIDEDGDGLDDRTGHTDNNKPPPDWGIDNNSNKPNRDDYTDDIFGDIAYGIAMIGYYIIMPFKLIGQGITSCIDMIGQAFGHVNVFSSMINGLFGFLPSEIQAMIGLMFASLLLISVLKLVRK